MFKWIAKHRLVSFIVAMILLLVVSLMFIRVNQAARLRKETQDNAIPIVSVIQVQTKTVDDIIILPGNVAAWHEATIYARTNGYLKKWYVDIGSHVKAGELLAEIDAPEIDAQLEQAEASLKVVMANKELARATADRWLNLIKKKFVSQQQADEKLGKLKALIANVIYAKARIEQLRQLVSFEKVVAPFDGIITSRATDIGALINAGNNATPLFHIVQPDPLRLYIRIPQAYSSKIKPNMTVNLHFQQHPGVIYKAKLFETANAIDKRTRTLLAQFIIDNKVGVLLPGSYAQVHLTIPIKNRVRIPVNTLLFRAEGLQVATLTKENTVLLKSVKINRDFGTEVEISEGLNPDEWVIINPPDSLYNGEKVRLAKFTCRLRVDDRCVD